MKKFLATTFLLFLSMLPTLGQHSYGWKGDSGKKKAPPFYSNPRYASMTIAPKSDLSGDMPPIWDQGTLGSCTAQGIARIIDFAHKKATGRFIGPSRLFIYYNERVLENTIEIDSGAQIVDGIRSVASTGACLEEGCALFSKRRECWPYEIAKFAVKPPQEAYRAAQFYKALRPYKVNNADGRSIRLALSNGLPVVFGSLVYSGIERVTSSNPVLEMPRRGERPSGGHAMTISGHDDVKQLYLIDNSWGTSYGVNGRFYIPYAYIHNPRLTEDAWIIEAVTTKK